jgi:hypothetical protein
MREIAKHQNLFISQLLSFKKNTSMNGNAKNIFIKVAIFSFKYFPRGQRCGSSHMLKDQLQGSCQSSRSLFKMTAKV